MDYMSLWALHPSPEGSRGKLKFIAGDCKAIFLLKEQKERREKGRQKKQTGRQTEIYTVLK
jgi:hypothetical protein